MSSIYYESQAQRLAVSAWNHLDLEPPVDLRAVVARLGIKLKKELMSPDVFGIYMRTASGTAVIGVNSGMTYERQRFTCAHEIGHHLFCHDLPGELFVKLRSDKKHPREREADRFAVELLMPGNIIIKHAKELGYPEYPDKLYNLCAKFGVSVSAMHIRLRELGLTPKQKTSAIIRY